MKKFLVHLWKYEDSLVVWTAIPLILMVIGISFGADFEMPSTNEGLFFAFILIGYIWMYWISYKDYKQHYSEDRFAGLIKKSTQRTEAYDYILSVGDDKKVKDFSGSASIKMESPEKFFSILRKIDWDELNKTRKYNGDLGEVFVYDLEKNYLTKIGRSDLAEKVHHVSKEGDGHGYDIKSFYENGSEKFIEVKATNASSGSTFNISKNEFSFLQTHLNNAVVYHVHNVNNERETTLVVYRASEVVNSPDISPSGYVVKM